jgi:FKBP-type peptidyl-prolyl cis-trans isomerase FkpA
MNKITLFFLLSIFAFSCKNNKKETEQEILSAYIEKLNKAADTLYSKTNGIYFIDKNLVKQDSIKPEIGDSVYLKYTGYILTKDALKSFIKVVADTPDVYIYKQESVIPGWERGIGMMSKNRPVTLIIPSDLAYGNRNEGMIPAFSTLVFDVEMLKLIKAVK